MFFDPGEQARSRAELAVALGVSSALVRRYVQRVTTAEERAAWSSVWVPPRQRVALIPPDAQVRIAEAMGTPARVAGGRTPLGTVFGRRSIVYHCVDRDGRVIYVGSTAHLSKRFATHVVRSEWWDDVDHVQTFECASADEMTRREREDIVRLDPPHNSVYGQKPRTPTTDRRIPAGGIVLPDGTRLTRGAAF